MSVSERRKKSIIVFMSLIIIMFSISVYAASTPSNTNLKRFSGMDELELFLKDRPLGSNIFMKDFLALEVTTMQTNVRESSQDYSYQYSYSTTNIQVSGVDEADIVKSDGR
ncbi:MAG: beta-propeller domain-containing protein, partial [Candidatus Methanomethyliaceae archaeon]